jgi:VanZ family protein
LKNIGISLFISYTVILLAATLAPSELVREANVFKLSDKFMHLVSFGAWSGSLYLLLVFFGTGESFKNSTISIIWGTFFGALIEVLQITLPVNRSFEYADILADFIGALLFVLVLSWIIKTKKSALF